MVEANLQAAFELVNKWREASGQEILSAWLPSVPQDSNACLLAAGFNKHCEVQYEQVTDRASRGDNSDTWQEAVGNTYLLGQGEIPDAPLTKMVSGSGQIIFDENENAELFAEISGFEFDGIGVILPDEIALVAYEFDNGAYSEYVKDNVTAM